VAQAQRYVAAGYSYVVDIDLEKFFRPLAATDAAHGCATMICPHYRQPNDQYRCSATNDAVILPDAVTPQRLPLHQRNTLHARESIARFT